MARSTTNLQDTIFALTTGTLPSGVAIVKLSGKEALQIARRVFSPFSENPGMFFGTTHDPEGAVIDKGLLLVFRAPNSHTGEDVVEFHLHGSKAVVSALEYSLEKLGARRAIAGEFSYRAFVNGKTTLEELENLGDVFATAQEDSLKRIYGRRDASLEVKVAELRNQLVQLQAILDTAVDFSDEYSNVVQSATSPLKLAIQGVSEIIQRYYTLKASPERPKLVVAGRPNAGKSSLFNAILCRYRAIVHSEPGTTRDVIEEEILLGKKSWSLVDTAGIRSAESTSERQGIEMGEDYLSGARYWFLVVDGSEGLKDEDFQLIEKYGQTPYRIIWNKSDKTEWRSPKDEWILSKTSVVSAEKGTGIIELMQQVSTELSAEPENTSLPTPTRVQAIRLEAVLKKLQELSLGLKQNDPPEYLAETNRQSLQLLEGVFGEVSVEDVLDRVFSEFCIGK